MSKNNAEVGLLEETVELVELYDDEITDADYGFVLDAEGNLKSVFMPTEYFEVPEKVRAIFAALGIDNPEDVYIHTVH